MVTAIEKLHMNHPNWQTLVHVHIRVKTLVCAVMACPGISHHDTCGSSDVRIYTPNNGPRYSVTAILFSKHNYPKRVHLIAAEVQLTAIMLQLILPFLEDAFLLYVI